MEELNELKRLIAISYGTEDKIFALHYYDRKQAQDALFEAFRIRVGFQGYVNLHREFLLSEGVTQDHVQEQLKLVKDLARYFTED